MPKSELGVLSAEIIVNILESYMEFVNTIDFYTDNFAIKQMCKRRIESWMPMLAKIKSDLEDNKSVEQKDVK